jgi:hypothetical protein
LNEQRRRELPDVFGHPQDRCSLALADVNTDMEMTNELGRPGPGVPLSVTVRYPADDVALFPSSR